MAPAMSARTLSLVIPKRAHPALQVEIQSRRESRDGADGTAAIGGPIRVLLVVSDRDNADWVIAELDRAGYDTRVDLALSRQEFGVRASGVSYDVILAEFSLRGWTGMDVLSTVYDRGIETPVIIINAADNDERARGWMEAGAADYITEANPKRLPLAVRRAIAESDARLQREGQDELVKKLSMALDQSPTSVMFTDLEGRIQYVNRRFTDLTGYPSDEAIGQTPQQLNSPSMAPTVRADLRKTVLAGQVWRGDLQNRKKNGELYWTSTSISPMRDSNGVISYFLASQEDITARKRDEQTVRDSEERFRQLADNLRDVFFVANASLSEMLYVSPGYEHLWGMSCQSLYDDPHSFIDAILPEDRETLFAFVGTHQKGQTPVPAEYRIKRPDGSIRSVLVRGAPIRDNDGVTYRMSGCVLDVTEQRAAEISLRESEVRFRLLTEASFDAIVIAVDGVIVESNYGLPRMLGYTVDEVIGRPVLDFVAEESRAIVESRMREEVVGIYEFIGMHKNGRKLVLEAAARNHQVDGRPARLTAVRDITEKRNLENQFRQAQKMEAVGRLAGGVAHDFNNLLTVIMAYTQLIEDELGPTSPLLDDLDEIQKASTAAATLTKQLLAFSRKQVIEPKLVSLNDVVGSAEKMLQRLIGEDIELATKLSDVPCPVILDPGQLDQVIMNLAVNARDAMPLGGKLTLETAIVDLDADYANRHWPAVAGRFAMLAVTDSGMGMSAETQARIFEPFFTTKETGKGTGLGLATVYGIVKQNNGFIWVYSEVDHGTTFKLYFPIATGVERTENPCEQTVQQSGTETVLIVEDSPSVRSAARRILRRCGYKVLEAPNGKAGLALARKKNLKIDLLLTDVIMPEMSGREIATIFAQLRPETKVLYMSGYTDDAIVRQGILQEGIAYLQKPFTGLTLSTRVREVLNVSCNGPRSAD
jgi:two-component system cell cycle sensor histidine kinase/response regulator CckA